MDNQRNEVKVKIGNVTTSFAVLGTSVKECLEEAIRMELAPKINYINCKLDVDEISRALHEELNKRGVARTLVKDEKVLTENETKELLKF